MNAGVASVATPRIVCPPWCVVPVEQHRADLSNLDGMVVHDSEIGDLSDGWYLSSITRPDGEWCEEDRLENEPAAPVVLMCHDRAYLPGEVEAMANRLRDLIAQAREGQR